MEEGAKFPVFAWPKRFFLYATTLLIFPHSGLATHLNHDGFREENVMFFRTPTLGNAAQAENSPAQGVNPARGYIFKNGLSVISFV